MSQSFGLQTGSARERQIIALGARGKTDKEIARSLGIRPGTVATYWQRIRARYGASSRGAAIAKALLETERRYQTVVNGIDQAVFQTDARGIFTFLSAAWERLLGYTVEESLGLCYSCFLPEGENDFAIERFTPLIRGELPSMRAPVRFQHKDGHIVIIEVHTTFEYDEDGVPGMAWGTYSDITDRIEVAEKLKTMEAMFQQLAACAPVGIFSCDTKGQCTYVNAKWLEMTGLTLDEALGTGWTNALHPDDRNEVYALWNECALVGVEFSLEFRFQKPNGDVVWVRSTAAPIRTDDGTIIGYVGADLDITAEHIAVAA